MYSPSRRLVALIATTATLGAGSLAVAAQASAAGAGSADSARSTRSLIDVVVSLVLSLLGANPTVSQVQAQTAALTPSQLGGLLQGASPGQLTAILGGGLTPAQLTSAVTSLAAAGELGGLLGTLTAGQTGDLLAPLTGSTLSGALGLLNTAQLLDMLSTLTPAELGSLVDGLAPTQTGSLLSAANPAQLTSLAGALTSGQLGGGLALLNTAQLTGLLGVANAALAGIPPGVSPAPVQHLITTVTGLLPVIGGAIIPSGTTPGGVTTPLIGTGAPARVVQAAAKPPVFTGYRASVGSIKVARNRRSAKMTVTCPAAAPVGCIVTLKGAVAGKKAFAGKPFVLLRKLKRTLTTKLSGAVSRRLKKKGGSLRVSALTMFSTLPTTTKTVRVARTR